MLNFQSWLDKIENLFGHLSTMWDGMLMITGDFNVDLLRPDLPQLQVKQYMDMLESLNLHQHVTRPTRVTASSTTLIDHITSNIPRRITYTNVLPCPSISDHDAPYACVNIRATRFKPRYKFIRHEKQFDEKSFLEDFAALPFSLVYGTDDIDDKLNIFNSLFKSGLASSQDQNNSSTSAVAAL